jgi:hypothetical protein
MSLSSRIEDMQALAGRIACARPSPLVCVHPVEAGLRERLRMAAALYLSACLPDRRVIVDEEALLEALERERGRVPNITPNGMIVPKRHTILEFNGLARAFADIVASLGLGELVAAWHVPLNLRVKFGLPSAENTGRSHETEVAHTDSWAGTYSDSVLVHLPVFGDLGRNYLAFYDPPADFDEGWLAPLPRFADGGALATRYRRLELVARSGELVLADFATLHQSVRQPGAGPRISIDTQFRLRRAPIPGAAEPHPARAAEYMSHEVVTGLGERYLLFFPDGVEHRVDNQGGFRHPSHWKLVALG